METTTSQAACDIDCNSNPNKKTWKDVATSCTIEAGEASEHAEKWYMENFMAHAKEIRELPTGYEVVFEKPSPEIFKNILFAFEEDTKCCSSFNLALLAEPNKTEVRYQYYGSKAIKQELFNTFKFLKLDQKIVKANSRLRNMGWFGVALCAVSCSLPLIGGIAGIGALTAASAYFEKIAIISLGLTAVLFLYLFYQKKQKAKVVNVGTTPNTKCGC